MRKPPFPLASNGTPSPVDSILEMSPEPAESLAVPVHSLLSSQNNLAKIQIWSHHLPLLKTLIGFLVALRTKSKLLGSLVGAQPTSLVLFLRLCPSLPLMPQAGDSRRLILLWAQTAAHLPGISFFLFHLAKSFKVSHLLRNLPQVLENRLRVRLSPLPCCEADGGGAHVSFALSCRRHTLRGTSTW